MPMMVTARLRDITSRSVCTPAIGTGQWGFDASVALNMATIGSVLVFGVGTGEGSRLEGG